MTRSSMDCNALLKRQARDINDEELGVVQEVDPNYVLTQKVMSNNTEKFYLPKYLLERFNLNLLWFKISKEEAKNGFMISSPPLAVTES
jgi:hypothetical protein